LESSFYLRASKSSIAYSVDVFLPWILSIRTRSSSAVGEGLVYPDLGPFPYSLSRSTPDHSVGDETVDLTKKKEKKESIGHFLLSIE